MLAIMARRSRSSTSRKPVCERIARFSILLRDLHGGLDEDTPDCSAPVGLPTRILRAPTTSLLPVATSAAATNSNQLADADGGEQRVAAETQSRHSMWPDANNAMHRSSTDQNQAMLPIFSSHSMASVPVPHPLQPPDEPSDVHPQKQTYCRDQRDHLVAARTSTTAIRSLRCLAGPLAEPEFAVAGQRSAIK